jgi:hypothetical protein
MCACVLLLLYTLYYSTRHAIIGMLESPPSNFKDVVKAHFYLRKDAIKEQVCVCMVCAVLIYCSGLQPISCAALRKC